MLWSQLAPFSAPSSQLLDANCPMKSCNFILANTTIRNRHQRALPWSSVVGSRDARLRKSYIKAGVWSIYPWELRAGFRGGIEERTFTSG
jgi:hypothetical protein